MTKSLDFVELQHVTNGMLAPAVYERIYEAAKAAPIDGCDMVEVGAAHGAATIAIASALQGHGSVEGRLFSFERAEGGSRARYGGKAENVRILKDNLARYDVGPVVQLLIGDVQELYPKAGGDGSLALLMLDADGAIDRDFRLFYNRLSPGSPIIIDDCQEWVKLKRRGGRTVSIDLKHVLTHELVTLYVSEGLLEEDETRQGTFFGRKPNSVTDPIDFTQLDTVAAYRALIFTEGKIPSRFSSSARAALARYPRLRRWLRNRLRT